MSEANTGPTSRSVLFDWSNGALFNADYYQSHCGPVPYARSEAQWPIVFGRIADQVIRTLCPRRVLDVGCALGFLVEAFRDRGVEAFGLDISPYAIANVRPDIAPYCWIGTASEHIGGSRYDLVVCIEVLEHMPGPDALQAIGHMAASTDTILFSSTPYDLDEPTHVNVQSIEYWIQSFAQYAFAPDLEYDPSFVVSHAILFRKSMKPQPPDVIHAYVALLHGRQQVVDRDNRVNELIRDLQGSQAQLASSLAELASLTSQLSRSQTALEAAGSDITKLSAEVTARDTTIAGLMRRVDKYSQQMVALELDLANARDTTATALSELRTLRVDNAKLLARVGKVEAELLDTQEARDQSEAAHELIRDDLEAAATVLSACLASDKVVVEASGLAAISDQVRLFEYRLKVVEERTVDTAMGLDAVTQSKIWRTLVKGAGIALKVLPRRR